MRVGNISVELSQFVLFFKQTSWTNVNSMIFKKLKTKQKPLTVQLFFNLQNHPTFHSEERLVHLERGREGCIGLSILLVYAWDLPIFLHDRQAAQLGSLAHWPTGWQRLIQCQNQMEKKAWINVVFVWRVNIVFVWIGNIFYFLQHWTTDWQRLIQRQNQTRKKAWINVVIV